VLLSFVGFQQLASMLVSTQASIQTLMVHRVGNAAHAQPLICSAEPMLLPGPDWLPVLQRFFLSSFTLPEYHAFALEDDSPTRMLATAIFAQPEQFATHARALAQHLYEVTLHPAIKSGDLYVVLFDAVEVENTPYRAIGLFKSEQKTAFLQTEAKNDALTLHLLEGTLPEKPDKACLILDTDADTGYRILCVDKSSRVEEARFWYTDFLGLTARREAFQDTRDMLELTRKFVTEKLHREFEVSAADKADLLHRSLHYFKEKDSFDTHDFNRTVFEQPDVADSFERYKQEVAKEKEMQIRDVFDISEPAVKRQQRVYKSVLKLDKNFHIYVHGNRELIERGFDPQKGMNFYKVYFKEEE
jgi:hypothetical protein